MLHAVFTHKATQPHSYGQTSMHLGMWMWSRHYAKVQTKYQNGEEGGFIIDFEHSMFVVARRAKLLIYLDFYTQPSLGFTENGLKNKKYPVSGSCLDESGLLI